jgi:thiol-disulfide isomerase/thioredoxin
MRLIFRLSYLLFFSFFFLNVSAQEPTEIKKKEIANISSIREAGFIPIMKELQISQEMTIIDGEKNSEIITLDKMKGLNIVNFWASWCGPCIEEISELNKFQEMILTKNLEVQLLGINIFDKKKEAVNFYLKYKPFFKILFDNKNTISVKFSIMGVPETYFVKDNKILFKYMGKINQDILERGINESLKY